MSQPESKTYLPSIAPELLLDVAECVYTAHTAIENNNPRLALTEIDKAIVFAQEARKILLGKPPTIATAEAQPELLGEKGD